MSWWVEIHAGRGPLEVCEFVDLVAARIESLARSAGFSVTRRADEAKHGGSRAVRLELRAERGAASAGSPDQSARGQSARGRSARGQSVEGRSARDRSVGARPTPVQSARGRSAGTESTGTESTQGWPGLPATLSAEAGTHALVNAARGRGARKRWFVGVDFWREEARETLSISDVRFEACRAGGPGGQHVNRTASAVRATHEPSGRSVRVERHRSQHRNKAEALALLRESVDQASSEAAQQHKTDASLRAYRFERGAAVRTYQLDSKGRLAVQAD